MNKPNNDDNYILELNDKPHYPNEIEMVIDYLTIKGEIIWEQEHPIYYLCECNCGNEVIRERRSLLYNKGIKSCGCYRINYNKTHHHNLKHNGAKRDKNGKQKRLYRIWVNMRQRCNNPHNCDYKWYGRKGIKVCNEWNNYKSFRKWAIKNGYKNNLTIERLDVTKDYSPDNCTWITKREQRRNTSNNSYFIINGEKILLQDLANKLNCSRKKIINMAIYGELKYDYWNQSDVYNVR